MELLVVVLLLIGAVCFALSAFGVAARINLQSAGLLAWILVPLISALTRM